MLSVMTELFDRKKVVEDKIRKAEAERRESLGFIREFVRDFLIKEKGYSDDEIETDVEFNIVLDDITITTSVDYILKINGKRFMAIKCSPGALESRDRHLISFARVVDSYQIPFAVGTDGARARILDVVSGRLLSEGLDSIPERERADEMSRSMELIPYPAERMEREKRILLAFDSIKCTEESAE
jgi:hypothetical protein